MKKTIICFIIISLVVFDNCVCAVSKEQTSYEYFQSGSKKYTELDNEGALENLEKAVSLNPNFKSAIGLLVIILAEESIMNYQSLEYEKALPYLNKLLKYVPNDREIRSIYNEAKNRVEENAPPPKKIIPAEERLAQDFLEVWGNYLRVKSQGYSLRDRLTFLKKIFSVYSGTSVDLNEVKEEIRRVSSEIAESDKNKEFNERFNLGLRKYKVGSFNEALAIWEELKKDFPKHETLESYITQARKELIDRITYLEGQAEASFKKGNWADAVRHWELVLELDPNRQTSMSSLEVVKQTLKCDFDKALQLYERKQYHSAIEKWRGILERYPNYPGVNACINKANSDLSTAESSAKLSAVQQYFKEADKYFAKGRYLDSVDMWRKVLKIDQLNEDAQKKISDVKGMLEKQAKKLYDEQKYVESKQKWELVLKIDANDKNARQNLDRCIKDFEEKENKYFEDGQNAFNSGDYLEALEKLKKVLLVSPGNKKAVDLVVESHLAQGVIYYRTEKLDEAIEQWSRALELSPDNAKAKTYKSRAVKKLETLKKLKGE